jgi:hypothetical protein
MARQKVSSGRGIYYITDDRLTRASPIASISHATRVSFGIDRRPRQRKSNFGPARFSIDVNAVPGYRTTTQFRDLLSRESHASRSGL